MVVLVLCEDGIVRNGAAWEIGNTLGFDSVGYTVNKVVTGSRLHFLRLGTDFDAGAGILYTMW